MTRRRFALIPLVPFFLTLSVAAGLSAPAENSAIPWDLETEYKYIFLLNGISIGEESLTVDEMTFHGAPALRIREKLKISDPASKLKQESELILSPDGTPLRYKKKLKVKITNLPSQSGRFKMEYGFSPGLVTYDLQRDGKDFQSDSMELPAGVTCFDNNMMDQLSILFSKVPWRRTEEIDVQSFHFSSNRVLNIKLKKVAHEKTMVNSKFFKCYKIQFIIEDIPIGEFWIDPDGRLLREVEKRGALIIELTNP